MGARERRARKRLADRRADDLHIPELRTSSREHLHEQLEAFAKTATPEQIRAINEVAAAVEAKWDEEGR